MIIKYQIFVSSTYEDLKLERDQVIKAILEMGHIPVGMEMFSAADDEQWETIKRQIDQSDYYVVIVAHRYGSVEEGISFTEKEYDYAVNKGVPVLGFVIDSGARWAADLVEEDAAKKEALANFKEKVEKKPVGFWTSAEDLHGKCSIALMKAITAHPRTGWTRASEVAGPETVKELSRLSSENAALRSELEELSKQQQRDIEERRTETLKILRRNKTEVSFWKKHGSEWEDIKEVSLYTIFALIAPEIVTEASSEMLSAFLGKMLYTSESNDLRTSWPIPRNSLNEWLFDLVTLSLVEPSSRKHSVNDTKDYWTLTEEGKGVYATIRRRSLLKAVESETEEFATASSSEQSEASESNNRSTHE